METQKNVVAVPPPDDLVEVKRPVSLLIAQFFLFPLIIIAICVGIFLLFGYLTYEQRTPSEYLSLIRTGSGTQRWQAAYELSNIVARDKKRVAGTNFVHEVIAIYRSSKDDDPRVRQFLAVTLGQLGDKQALPSLLDGLNDSRTENQISCLLALGLIADNSAVPGILNQLQSKDPAVRKMAAYVLGAIKDPAAIHDLEIALNDPSEEVRWHAAMSLAQMNRSSGAGILVELLDRNQVEKFSGLTPDQRSELIVNAVKCLGMLKYEQARDRIVALSKADPDFSVRDASMEALRKF